jgi:hypothetical protein
MKRLYLAICPTTDFSIVVCADNTKSARQIMLRNFDEEYESFVATRCIEADMNFDMEAFIRDTREHVNNMFAQDNFKITRVDRLSQLPEDWKEAYPWDDELNLHYNCNCKEIFVKYKKELKEKKKRNKEIQKLQFIKEQAARLDKILQKKGVDALFLYSLIDHGLNEDVVEYWKKEYFPPLLRGVKYLYENDKGVMQGNTFYIDKSNDTYDIIWVLAEMGLSNSNKMMISKMIERITLSLFDRSGEKTKDIIKSYKLDIIEKSFLDPVELRKYTLAGLEYTYCRKYR